MKYNISKELFEAVMYTTITSSYVEDTVSFGYQLAWKNIDEEWTYINIDSFFFKCKEWIETKYCGYIVLVDDTVYLMRSMFNEGGDYYDEKFTSETIQQSLFDACEWIRKELLK